MDYQTSFYQQMMPYALAVSQKTGIDPRIVIAQSALETGHGQHAPNNNYFGIKGPGQSFNTTEYSASGAPYSTSASFRKYNDMASSAADYANFINNNSRYDAFRTAPDFQSQLAALQKSGYATDPNYARNVGKIAQGITIDPNMQPYTLPTLEAGTTTQMPPAGTPGLLSNPTNPMATPMDGLMKSGLSLMAQANPRPYPPPLPMPQTHRGTFNGFGLLGNNYYG